MSSSRRDSRHRTHWRLSRDIIQWNQQRTPPKWQYLRLSDMREHSDQGDFRCWRAVDSSCWYPWLEDLFAFGLPYQINSQLLVIWLLLSTKLCFHFTVWVARSRPHLNVFNYFFIIHGNICKLYNWIWTLYMASRRTACILFEFTYIYIWKQTTHSARVWFHGQYPT